MTYDVETFLAAIRPELERQVDEQILAEPDPEARLVLMTHRSRLVSEAVHATRAANLKHRLAEAEARLKPTLVQ